MISEKKKLKLLYLARILQEETDEHHGLTMPQIIDRLLEFGIAAERKSIYRDLAALEEAGANVVRLKTSPVEYAITNRTFLDSELVLLIDAVQSSRFLTKRKSHELVSKIKSLGSRHQVKELSKRVHVEGRIKMQNESVFYSVDAIQKALEQKSKVRFRYFQYDCYKNQVLRKHGAYYVETPVELVYSEGCYYLIAFNEKHESFVNYRVDRMLNVKAIDEPAAKNNAIACFDVEEYESRAFSMYSGEPVYATLRAHPDLMGPIIDRFGKDVRTRILSNGIIHVYARVVQSPTFYGWVAQFGGRMEIEAPPPLRRGYVDFIEKIRSVYDAPEGREGSSEAVLRS